MKRRFTLALCLLAPLVLVGCENEIDDEDDDNASLQQGENVSRSA